MTEKENRSSPGRAWLRGLAVLIIGILAFCPMLFLPQKALAQDLTADALVLVNSASPSYDDFEHYIQPYLENFGVPYAVLDISLEDIEDNVAEYAATMYERTNGVEFVVLDCIGFLRHFLHLFHRLRHQFLDTYQRLLLEEPESSVRHELKEAFIGLRRAAESSEV